MTLKKAPIPTVFSPSLASKEIHCESMFVCTRYPVNAVAREARKATTPVIHVMARRPRQAAIQNFPQRCTTMKIMNSCTLQKCTLLVKWPSDEVWYQAGPAKERTRPDARITRNAAIVRTPKT